MHKEKKKILVIDDEVGIRFILEKILSQDFEVVCLTNGEEGLAYLEAGNFPDMIISDLQMPEMDGFDFLSKVKNSGFFDEIPIMILSGGESCNDKIRCFNLGAEDYVVKPFNPSEVIARINRRLEVKERYLSLVG